MVLKGRFAERLGFNNRDHDYNLMDADPDSSGPFFEQIYPYKTAYRGDDKSLVPLARFRYPKLAMGQDTSKLKNMIRVKDYDSAVFQSSLQFSQFYRLVAIQVVITMQDYTKNNMRILGSLTTMRAPGLGKLCRISRSLNASAQGQIDKEQLAGEINKTAYSIPGGFRLISPSYQSCCYLDIGKADDELSSANGLLHVFDDGSPEYVWQSHANIPSDDHQRHKRRGSTALGF